MHFQGFLYHFKDINGARNHEGDILEFGVKLLFLLILHLANVFFQWAKDHYI